MSRSELARSTDALDGTGVIAALEAQVAAALDFPFVLGMSSATTALGGVADALGLTAGDEVIVPALTPAETVVPMLRLGCTLVLADTDPETMTLDPAAVAGCRSPRTRALVAVDLVGMPQATRALRQAAGALPYVADCAQGFGARRDGRPSGYAADAVVLSLNAQKELAAGEGGLLLTRSRTLYERVLQATQHPRRQARALGRSRVNHFSLNGRLNPLAAAAACACLPGSDARIAHRRRHACAVVELLTDSGLVAPIRIPAGAEPSYTRLTLSWTGTPQPVALLAVLATAGVPARLHDLPVRPLPWLPGLPRDQVRIPRPLRHAEAAVREHVCLELPWS